MNDKEEHVKTLKASPHLFEAIVEQVLSEIEELSEESAKLVRLKAGQKYILEEGLIKTESYEKTVSFIRRNINLIKNRILCVPVLSNRTYYIKFDIHRYNQDIINDIIRLMNLCGWFLSSILHEGNTLRGDLNNFLKTYNKKDSFCLCFDAKFDLEKSMADLPPKLYHCTFDCNIKNIENHGLFPKDRSNISSYPSRVYFAYDIKDVINFGINKLTEYRNNNKYYNDINLAIYELDVSQLKREYKFMEDVNSDFDAVYCLEPIPYYALKLIQTKKIQ